MKITPEQEIIEFLEGLPIKMHRAMIGDMAKNYSNMDFSSFMSIEFGGRKVSDYLGDSHEDRKDRLRVVSGGVYENNHKGGEII